MEGCGNGVLFYLPYPEIPEPGSFPALITKTLLFKASSCSVVDIFGSQKSHHIVILPENRVDRTFKT